MRMDRLWSFEILLAAVMMCILISAAPHHSRLDNRSISGFREAAAARRKEKPERSFNSVTHPDLTWPNSRVLYSISNNFTISYANMIAKAMSMIEEVSCITFSRVRNKPKLYLRIERTEIHHCSTPAGISRTNNTMCLSQDKCNQVGIIVHELMHALGFYHEQQREDRDQYVKIIDTDQGRKPNYELRDQSKVSPYDYRSIMHYPEKEGKVTYLEVTNTRILRLVNMSRSDVGQRKNLSVYDIADLNHHYNCSEKFVGCKDTLADCVKLSTDPTIRYCELKSPEVVKATCAKTCGLCRMLRKRQLRKTNGKKKPRPKSRTNG